MHQDAPLALVHEPLDGAEARVGLTRTRAVGNHHTLAEGVVVIVVGRVVELPFNGNEVVPLTGIQLRKRLRDVLAVSRLERDFLLVRLLLQAGALGRGEVGVLAEFLVVEFGCVLRECESLPVNLQLGVPNLVDEGVQGTLVVVQSLHNGIAELGLEPPLEIVERGETLGLDECVTEFCRGEDNLPGEFHLLGGETLEREGYGRFLGLLAGEFSLLLLFGFNRV